MDAISKESRSRRGSGEGWRDPGRFAEWLGLFCSERQWPGPNLRMLRGTQACIVEGELAFVQVCAQKSVSHLDKGLQKIIAPQEAMETEATAGLQGLSDSIKDHRERRFLKGRGLDQTTEAKARPPGEPSVRDSEPLAGAQPWVHSLPLAFAYAVPFPGTPFLTLLTFKTQPFLNLTWI